MKTLIEKSIKIKGIGRPDIKTIFDEISEEEKNNYPYKDISTIGGRKISIEYKFLENNQEFSDNIMVIIPKTSEIEIKNFIILEINNKLNI